LSTVPLQVITMSGRFVARCSLPAALLVAALAGACRTAASVATATPQAVEDRAIRRELTAVNAEMAATFNRGDYLGAARFYSDDAQIIGTGGVRVTGRAAIDRYWTSIPAGSTWRLDVLDAGGSRDSPWQLGRSTLVMPGRDPGAASNTSIVDFVAVWKRQPDGTLKLYIDMYVPAPRPRPTQ
jgi:ketosteroid isomerase-like protein